MMNLQECMDAWNAQADEWNQWDKLSCPEQCEWCIKMQEEINHE